jgi:hypothetical protein
VYEDIKRTPVSADRANGFRRLADGGGFFPLAFRLFVYGIVHETNFWLLHVGKRGFTERMTTECHLLIVVFAMQYSLSEKISFMGSAAAARKIRFVNIT